MVEKALVLYVWDNDRSEVVGLFRAVGPGMGAKEMEWPKRRFQRLYDSWGIGVAAERLGVPWPREPLPLTFDIAAIRTFAARLSASYPPPRYAIRDWLAESLEDFFISRYQATRVELAAGAMGRLLDPFAMDLPSAAPVALGDYRRWSPTGIETASRPLGLGLLFEGDVPLQHPSRRYAVLKKAAFEHELRKRGLDPRKARDKEAYFSELREKGYRIGPGLPEPWIFSAASQSEAKKLFLRHAATDVAIIHFTIPTGDQELADVLHYLYGADIYRSVEEDYFFRGRIISRDRFISAWFVSHRQECLRAFGPGLLCDAERPI